MEGFGYLPRSSQTVRNLSFAFRFHFVKRRRGSKEIGSFSPCMLPLPEMVGVLCSGVAVHQPLVYEPTYHRTALL
jgi:hypothetical protein